MRNRSNLLAAGLLMLAVSGLLSPAAAAPHEVRLTLVGAGKGAVPEPGRAPPSSHFLAQARRLYDHVLATSDFRQMGAFDQIYPGIDVVYFGDEHHFECVFRLRPGADPSLIRLRLESAGTDTVTAEGHVVLNAESFEAYLYAPVAYREGETAQERLDGRYSIGFDNTVALSVQTLTPEERERLNGSRFNLVPADQVGFGPDYDFYMDKYELTHEQYLIFLNDAERHPDSPRGTNMVFDAEGNVWINPDMNPARDAMFQIRYSHLTYDPERRVGERYRHATNPEGRTDWRHHPIAGVTWFGAVKYSNWLTVHSGRGLDQRCYTEGTNMVDWAPVTATNWARGYFYAHEREAWLELEGFRLPMFKTFGDRVSTNAYNEFLNAASWHGTTNMLYGFGRNEMTPEAANTLSAALLHYGSTLPVGFFDGRNTLGDRQTMRDDNFYGLFDMSGNVSEWLTDPGRQGAPDTRILAGGSYADIPGPVERIMLTVPGRASDSGGFRVMTTHLPAETIRIHVLMCFHRIGGMRAEDAELFGPAWIEDPDPAEPPPVTVTPDPEIPEDPGITDPTELPEVGAPEVPGLTRDRLGDEPEPDPDPAPVPPIPPPFPPGPLDPPEPPPDPVRMSILSRTPDSGVVIAVSRPDSFGQTDGVTAFDRFYAAGTTVSVTAPAMADGRVFQMWRRNGITVSTQLSITVELISDLELTAVYQAPEPPPTPVRMSIFSRNPDSGVVIAVSRPDSFGQTDGVTAFDRIYAVGTTVSVTAPAMADGRVFQMWRRNGITVSTQLSITLELISDLELTAVYLTPDPPPERTLTVDSQNPDGGVGIGVSAADNQGLGDGVTTFQRVYFDGTRVVLVAPGVQDGNDFLYWFSNGSPIANDPTLQLHLLRDTRVTAVFGPPVPDNVRYLTVESVNPDSGVTISVDVPDNLNRADGETTFTREYNYGQLVTLTAPPDADGNSFVRWLRNGIEFSTNQTVEIPLISHTLMTAVYESPPPDIELRVRSANPGSGVAISVTQPDVNGDTDGVTAFSRIYSPGSQTVLTAPAQAPNGNTFLRWLLNGVPLSTNLTINLELHADSEATAVYVAPPAPDPEWTLDVRSRKPDSGVSMSVSAPDLDGLADGETAFTRRYGDGESVTVTAPTTAPNGNLFDRWMLNGRPVSTRQSISVIMNSNITLEAVYLDPDAPLQHVLAVRSQSPNSGVAVQIDPPDVDGQSSELTPFDRLYDHGAIVTLTARDPALPGSANTFKHWLMNGTPYSTEVTVSIPMLEDVEMTAVYGTPPPFDPFVTLTVESENPASGVAIAVSAVDTNGLANGTTVFDRVYINGTMVSLTAPALSPEGGAFLRWDRNGTPLTSDTTATLQMLADTVMRAVYAPPSVTHLLTVGSVNPGSGVPIVVDTPDVDGRQNGVTEFVREYLEGESVSLTAPPEAPNGNVFEYWEVNGVAVTTNAVLTVELLQDTEVRAVYTSPGTVTLAVRSLNPESGIAIQNTTPDLNGRGDGLTAFDRIYDPGAQTVLTAPSVNPDGAPFSYWLRNGTVFTTNTSVQVELLAYTEMTAVYGEPPPEPYILQVSSSNPDSGVPISISPIDTRNRGDGTTTFARLYDGGELVTATAPATAPGGNGFRQWILDGLPLTTNRTVQVLMNSNHELIAEYGTPIQPNERTLTVTSSNPATGVAIAIAQPDINGNSDGLTSFTRTYNVGDPVTVTAPQQSGTNNTEFVRWELNGQPYSTDLSVSLQMFSDTHLKAVYAEPDPDVVLTVRSRNPDSGVTINVSPGDIAGDTGGETEFDRTYPFGTTVTLTAPGTAFLPGMTSTNQFSHWEFGDGDIFSTNTVVSVTMLTNLMMTAVYDAVPPPALVRLTVNSQNPDSNVAVVVTPDVNGDAGDRTTFERFYEYAESVTLIAPPTSQGMVFERWLRNGIPYSTAREVTIEMFSDVTMTAVFREPEPSPSGL